MRKSALTCLGLPRADLLLPSPSLRQAKSHEKEVAAAERRVAEAEGKHALVARAAEEAGEAFKDVERWVGGLGWVWPGVGPGCGPCANMRPRA